MPNLTTRNQAIEAYVNYIAVKSGQSRDLARAFVHQFDDSKKCKSMDEKAQENMYTWLKTNYFPYASPPEGMKKAVVQLVVEMYGKLSKSEVVEAFKLAAGGRLADVSLDAPFTPQLIGKVLKAYEDQKRGELIKAYYQAEMERQKQASQTGYVHLTESDMEAVREGIRKVAREWGKKENLKHGYYMDYIQPLLDAGAIRDLSDERKEVLQRNAESDARVEQYRYNQTRGRQGFMQINKAIELSEDDKVNAFKALYAHELIALNLTYFATQF